MLKRFLESLAFSPMVVLLIACAALFCERQGERHLRTAYRISIGGLLLVLLLTHSAFLALVSAPLDAWVPDNTLEKA